MVSTPAEQQPDHQEAQIPQSDTLHQDDGERQPHTSNRSLNSGQICIAILFTAVLVWLIISSRHPLYTSISTVLAILPAGFIAKIIARQLHDDAVPNSFLFTQFILGSIVLSLGVLALEFTLTLVLIAIFFRKEAVALSNSLSDSTSNPSITPEQATAQLIELLKQIPIWKMIIAVLFVSLVIAALCEEASKWMLARRYRRVNHISDNVANERRISVRGILAVASTGALGFAAVENLGFVLGLATPKKGSFPFQLVALSLLRASLAFPLHIGAQFYIALAAAQRHLLGDGPSVFASFFIAITFHGLFDAVALAALLLVTAKVIPQWAAYFVTAVQAVFVLLLMMLCRSRYKALIEREFAVSSEATAV